eukprot:2846123-Amphidinium_carterae.1
MDKAILTPQLEQPCMCASFKLLPSRLFFYGPRHEQQPINSMPTMLWQLCTTAPRCRHSRVQCIAALCPVRGVSP